jgi:hypothetical protein
VPDVFNFLDQIIAQGRLQLHAFYTRTEVIDVWGNG